MKDHVAQPLQATGYFTIPLSVWKCDNLFENIYQEIEMYWITLIDIWKRLSESGQKKYNLILIFLDKNNPVDVLVWDNTLSNT